MKYLVTDAWYIWGDPYRLITGRKVCNTFLMLACSTSANETVLTLLIIQSQDGSWLCMMPFKNVLLLSSWYILLISIPWSPKTLRTDKMDDYGSTFLASGMNAAKRSLLLELYQLDATSLCLMPIWRAKNVDTELPTKPPIWIGTRELEV